MSLSSGRRILRAALVLTVAVLTSGLFTAPASAESSTYLRLAHFSPDAPAVDVYVASAADPDKASVVLRGVSYGNISPYQIVPSGPYIVSMRPAGAAQSTPAVIAITLDAQDGSAYTVAGVGAFDSLDLAVLNDDLTLPPDGQGRARIIHAAASESNLDIELKDGMSLGEGIDFAATTEYSNVPAQDWVLQVSADGETLLETPFAVEAGAVYSVLVLDTPTGLAVVTQVDALATAVVPDGGVNTGGGWAATHSATGADTWTVPAIVILSVLMLVGVVGVGVRARVRASAKAAS